jgi:hypothetical protein
MILNTYLIFANTPLPGGASAKGKPLGPDGRKYYFFPKTFDATKNYFPAERYNFKLLKYFSRSQVENKINTY